jgi:nucleotide-binding universal stress UspA family protein
VKKYLQILVGIDFSPASREAVRAAARVAAFDRGHVTVLHVMDPLLADEMKENLTYSDAELSGDMAKRVRAFLSQSGIATEQMEVQVEVGHPFVQLMRGCNRLRADLLILGARGTKHGPTQIGVMAAKCLRKAPADVLLVRENESGPFKRVLVCVDFSETSALAVQAARKIAAEDHGKLDCLFVYQSALAMSLDYGDYLPASVLAGDSEGAAAWSERLRGFLQPLMEGSNGLDWSASVKERPNVREVIRDEVQHRGADLVVLGTRGKTDLRSLIMGSTAERIVSHAPCSVLAVKPPGFEYEIV